MTKNTGHPKVLSEGQKILIHTASYLFVVST